MIGQVVIMDDPTQVHDTSELIRLGRLGEVLGGRAISVREIGQITHRMDQVVGHGTPGEGGTHLTCI
jgi:hypothetical protein